MSWNEDLRALAVEFVSGSKLDFNINLEQDRRGWKIVEFQFHLRFNDRTIGMIRIHLNPEASYDPVNVPRCHFYIGDSEAHIPFLVMSRRLILRLLCEIIEPDIGV